MVAYIALIAPTTPQANKEGAPMKTVIINAPNGTGGDILRRAMSAIFWRISDAGSRRHSHRIAAARLSEVSDRTLKDIGIHRSEITSIIHDVSGDRRRFHEGA